MAPVRKFTVAARRADLSIVDQIPLYQSLQLVPRFNAVGSWQVVYPASDKGFQAIVEGGGLIVTRKGSTVPVLTGPCDKIVESRDGGTGNIIRTFSGPCDNAHLADRMVLPQPSSVPGTGTPASLSQTVAYDYQNSVVETAMRHYVNVNAGPGAIAARRTTGLVLQAADGLQGGSAAYNARFDNLLALLQSLASSSGLGFQVQQVANQLVFIVYTPVDRTGLIRFSGPSGSLGAYSFTKAAPTASTVIVGDGGSGTGRLFDIFTNTSAEAEWGRRIESFVSQASNTGADTAQVLQAGADAIAAGGAQAQVTFAAVDTPRKAYGVDYGLGDKVTIELGAGAAVADVVREVTITDDASNGLTSVPTIGTQGSSNTATTPALYKALSFVLTQLAQLQRRQ